MNISIVVKYILGILAYPFYKKFPQVFLYHEVTNKPCSSAKENNSYITKEIFEKQILWIKQRYEILDPEELANKFFYSKTKKPLGLITFDDGSESIFRNAAPILRKYNIKALLFLNTEPMEGGYFVAGLVSYFLSKNKKFKNKVLKENINKKDPFLRFKKSDIDKLIYEVKENELNKKLMLYSGKFGTYENARNNKDVFTYGNHLYNHYNAAMLTPKQLSTQFNKNAKSLKKINGRFDLFAYPYGQRESCFNKDTDKFMIQNKVKKVFYNCGGLNKNLNSHFIDRIALGNSFDLGYMKYSTSGRHLIRNLKKFFLKH